MVIRLVLKTDHEAPADPRVYRGGTARIDPERVQMLKREGLGPAAIAASLGISRMSVYRVLKSNGITKERSAPSPSPSLIFSVQITPGKTRRSPAVGSCS
jgi:hypothetical protein